MAFGVPAGMTPSGELIGYSHRKAVQQTLQLQDFGVESHIYWQDHVTLSSPQNEHSQFWYIFASTMIEPRGPAAAHLPSTHPSNPYKFPPGLWYAGKLPPRVTDKYVFFFGYEGEDPHVCLQQWFPSPFKAPKSQPDQENEEVEFPTTEHYMMYQKAVLMGDTEIANKILSETHPSAAKRLGREVKNFDLEIWKKHADQVVEDANYYKFSQNEDMKEVLLGTGDKIIVEASPDDKIWGIGFNSEDAEGHQAEWGNNGLGKALMKVREKLRE